MPEGMCVRAASSLCSPVPAPTAACKAPGVSGSSGELMAIRGGCLWEGLGAVWVERDLTLKDLCGHAWGGKPCCRESPVPTGSRHLPWEVSAIAEFL